MMLYKDEGLDRLATIGNVAQFVSFRVHRSEPLQSFSRIKEYAPNHKFDSMTNAVSELITKSTESRVNIRSYVPGSPRSQEFIYGLNCVDEVCGNIRRLTEMGLDTIVNETIDVTDGGVSGVIQRQVVEFAPDDTPRTVEKSGVCSLPKEHGLKILSKVYKYTPAIPELKSSRIEFSIHPRPRGWRNSHTLLWEVEDNPIGDPAPAPVWPNKFSRHIGDKTFGLLVAETYGVYVPFTVATCRRLSPFQFGKPTGSGETWMRTAPSVQQPGLYATTRGWSDPFEHLARSDPNKEVAAILAQEGVDAKWSGAAITTRDNSLLIEGIEGYGDQFMLGNMQAQEINRYIESKVRECAMYLSEQLGPVRLEWVWDGSVVWVIQLHAGVAVSDINTIVPGEALEWIRIDASMGLEEIRILVEKIPNNTGIEVFGRFGVTSHKADLLRKRAIPSVFV